MSIRAIVLTTGLLAVGAQVSAQLPDKLQFVRRGGGVDPILGDVDKNCIVNLADLDLVLDKLGSADGSADLNNDGVVNGIDADIVTAVFGAVCGRRLIGDVDGNGIVGTADLVQVFSDLGGADPRSDIDGDGSVNQVDVDMVEANFGRNLARRLPGDLDGNDVIGADDLVIVFRRLGDSSPSLADVNLDGLVDAVDLHLVQAQFGANSGGNLTGDVNGDRVVNLVDLDLVEAGLLSNWRRVDVNGDHVVNLDDVALVLANLGTIAGEELAGDVNGDWVVDDVDGELVSATLGTSWPQADLNGDGAVGLADLNVILANFGDIYGRQFLGDVNGDCRVDRADERIVRATLGSVFAPADLDQDGTVDINDLGIVLATFGNTCP